MDYVSVDAYYPLLTPTNTPTVQELLDAWAPIVWYLESIAVAQNKSIAFTEVGYCSSLNATLEPAHCSGAVYQDNQVNAYEALFETFFSQPWFMGLHLWAWVTDPTNGGLQDAGYTPHNKPASQVMQKWLIDSASK